MLWLTEVSMGSESSNRIYSDNQQHGTATSVKRRTIAVLETETSSESILEYLPHKMQLDSSGDVEDLKTSDWSSRRPVMETSI